jgi:hypothetical protein
MPFGLKDKELPYRDIPKIPEIFYEQKVDFNTIFCWSKKPSGLVIEYTFKG